jgi:hypothetical protein
VVVTTCRPAFFTLWQYGFTQLEPPPTLSSSRLHWRYTEAIVTKKMIVKTIGTATVLPRSRISSRHSIRLTFGHRRTVSFTSGIGIRVVGTIVAITLSATAAKHAYP